jgi:hyperosmotically inducible periplasmic protein
MKFTKRTVVHVAFLAFVALLSASFPAFAQDNSSPPAADNSKTNRGDTDQGAVTADQQKSNPADRETTRSIRAAIMKDKSLSTYAHNVKVITQDGKVTLKGPVRSDDEKMNVEAKAVAVAGADNVTNQLTVVPPKQ